MIEIIGKLIKSSTLSTEENRYRLLVFFAADGTLASLSMLQVVGIVTLLAVDAMFAGLNHSGARLFHAGQTEHRLRNTLFLLSSQHLPHLLIFFHLCCLLLFVELILVA